MFGAGSMANVVSSKNDNFLWVPWLTLASKKVFAAGSMANVVSSKNDDFLWVPWLILASKKVFVFGAGSMANV